MRERDDASGSRRVSFKPSLDRIPFILTLECIKHLLSHGVLKIIHVDSFKQYIRVRIRGAPVALSAAFFFFFTVANNE